MSKPEDPHAFLRMCPALQGDARPTGAFRPSPGRRGARGRWWICSGGSGGRAGRGTSTTAAEVAVAVAVEVGVRVEVEVEVEGEVEGEVEA